MVVQLIKLHFTYWFYKIKIGERIIIKDELIGQPKAPERDKRTGAFCVHFGKRSWGDEY
ncbi:hypothetical protein ABIE66_000624 [Peribacillus sp. B2I2]|uniref:hypothetical protein n=1 Tax=unclassified Peribacillus TaxID=2675266 RepID=UPI0025A2F880|nr:hypothetical protein [Peribacillus sp. ACCC06369]